MSEVMNVGQSRWVRFLGGLPCRKVTKLWTFSVRKGGREGGLSIDKLNLKWPNNFGKTKNRIRVTQASTLKRLDLYMYTNTI